MRERVPVDSLPNFVYNLTKLEPSIFHPREFGKTLTSISKDFVEIYNQSQQTEELGLNRICGPGYGKSLEFLIKDYAILKNPAKEKEIKEQYLSNVIKDYVEDTRIKAVAERATWLRNDENHYERIWIEKDISDLKSLIELTVRWIESEQITEDYMKTMSKRKK